MAAEDLARSTPWWALETETWSTVPTRQRVAQLDGRGRRFRCANAGGLADPRQDEYRRLVEPVSGTYLQLGVPGVRLNPFDLELRTRADGRRSAPTDTRTRQKLFLTTVIRVLFSEQSPD